MDPDRNDLVADGALGLRDLVLMVGESQIGAARVDIEALAQILHRHRGALDVPAREPLAPRARPFHDAAGTRGLPQREVGRMSLPWIRLEIAVSLTEFVQCVARQLAVPVEARDVVVDRPVVDHVGVTRVDEHGGQLDHLLDVLGRLRIAVGRPDPERRRVLEHRVRVFLRDLGRRQSLVLHGELHLVDGLGGGFVGHVSDVGDVHDLRHPQPLELERATDQVVEHEASEVPQMGVAIHRRTAGIHRDVARFDGHDLVHPTREGVEQPHRHRIVAVERARRAQGGTGRPS